MRVQWDIWKFTGPEVISYSVGQLLSVKLTQRAGSMSPLPLFSWSSSCWLKCRCDGWSSSHHLRAGREESHCILRRQSSGLEGVYSLTISGVGQPYQPWVVSASGLLHEQDTNFYSVQPLLFGVSVSLNLLIAIYKINSNGIFSSNPWLATVTSAIGAMKGNRARWTG